MQDAPPAVVHLHDIGHLRSTKRIGSRSCWYLDSDQDRSQRGCGNVANLPCAGLKVAYCDVGADNSISALLVVVAPEAAYSL